MRGAGLAQRAPGGRTDRTGDADGKTAHHQPGVTATKMSVKTLRDGLAKPLQWRRPDRRRQALCRAGAHIPGGIDTLAGQPAFVIETGRIAKTARRLQTHRQLPALARPQGRALAIPGQQHPARAAHHFPGHSEVLHIDAQPGSQRICLRQVAHDPDQQRVTALKMCWQTAGQCPLGRMKAIGTTGKKRRHHQHGSAPPPGERHHHGATGQRRGHRGRWQARRQHGRRQTHDKGKRQTEKTDWHGQAAPSPGSHRRPTLVAAEAALAGRFSARRSLRRAAMGRDHNHRMQPSSKRCASSSWWG